MTRPLASSMSIEEAMVAFARGTVATARHAPSRIQNDLRVMEKICCGISAARAMLVFAIPLPHASPGKKYAPVTVRILSIQDGIYFRTICPAFASLNYTRNCRRLSLTSPESSHRHAGTRWGHSRACWLKKASPCDNSVMVHLQYIFVQRTIFLDSAD